MAYNPHHGAHQQNTHALWLWERIKALLTELRWEVLHSPRDRPAGFAPSRYRFWRGDQPGYGYPDYYGDYDQQAALYSPPQHNSMCPVHQFGCSCHVGYSPLTAAAYQPWVGYRHPAPPYRSYGELSVGSQDSLGAHKLSPGDAVFYTHKSRKRLSPPPQYSASPAPGPPSQVFVGYAEGANAGTEKVHGLAPSPSTTLTWSPGASAEKEKGRNLAVSSAGAPPAFPSAQTPALKAPHSVMSCPPALPSSLPTANHSPGNHTPRGILRKPRSRHESRKHTINSPANRPPTRRASSAVHHITLPQHVSPPNSRESWGPPLSKILRLPGGESRLSAHSHPRRFSYSPKPHGRQPAVHQHAKHQHSPVSPSPGHQTHGRSGSQRVATDCAPQLQLQHSPRSPTHPSPRRHSTPPQAHRPMPATTASLSGGNLVAARPLALGRKAHSEQMHAATSPLSPGSSSLAHPPSGPVAPANVPCRSSTAPPSSNPRWSSPASDSLALRAKIIRRLESKRSPRPGSSSSGWSARATSGYSGPSGMHGAFERDDHFSMPCGSDVCEA